MIINNTQARLYMCAFKSAKGEKGIAKVMLKPDLNVVDNDLAKDLLKHPGFKARLDIGMLKIIEPKKPVEVEAETDVKAEVKKEEKTKKGK